MGDIIKSVYSSPVAMTTNSEELTQRIIEAVYH